MITVFFAYSHKDEDMRDKLDDHLSTLKRQGKIKTWHDRRIGAGKDLDNEIDANLKNSDIVILLVSAHFIASDYCYNIEMEHALKRHSNAEARVIPVILHPCDWKNTPLGKLRATPRDGLPVSNFPNQHDAFLDITMDIRHAVEEITKSQQEVIKFIETIQQDGPKKQQVSEDKPKSSNIRVRKKFTDIMKARYLSEAFDYIMNFFFSSLAELETSSTDIETESLRTDANSFVVTIYRSGNITSQCKIWMTVDSHSTGDIRYSTSVASRNNSWNEFLSIDDDGYVLGLKALGMHGQGVNSKTLLSKEEASELFWSILIEPLQ